jgi:hypothetical protein
MKHLIIAADSGSHVYFDHPNGRMICMPLVTQFDVATENFQDEWKTIRCDKTILVFAQKSYMCFLSVSDQGESENYLRFQIQFIMDMFILKYGPEVYEEKSINFSKPSNQRMLGNLFNTAKSLFCRKQNFLLLKTF